MQDVLKSTRQKTSIFILFGFPYLELMIVLQPSQWTEEFSDPRASYYWDEKGFTGSAWQDLLELQSAAWDIYFLYPSQGTKWIDKPDKPLFWMHQLRGVEMAPYLDKDEFKLKMLQLLKAEKQKNPVDAKTNR